MNKLITCSVLFLASALGCVGHPLLYDNVNYRVVIPEGTDNSRVTAQPFRFAYEGLRKVVRTETHITKKEKFSHNQLVYRIVTTWTSGFDADGNEIELTIKTDSKLDTGDQHGRKEWYNFQTWSYHDSDGGYFDRGGGFVPGQSTYERRYLHPGQGEPTGGSNRTGPRRLDKPGEYPENTPDDEGVDRSDRKDRSEQSTEEPTFAPAISVSPAQ